jgi:hypothetical protein
MLPTIIVFLLQFSEPPGLRLEVSYDLTRSDFPTNNEFPAAPEWTSLNTTVFGAKIGDRTRDVEKNFGRLTNVRTLENEYLTIYCNNSLFVYTSKATGELIRMDIFESFADYIRDANLKWLMVSADTNFLHHLMGAEEGIAVNAENQSTEYIYDRRGLRFVKYMIGTRVVSVLRLQKVAGD